MKEKPGPARSRAPRRPLYRRTDARSINRGRIRGRRPDTADPGQDCVASRLAAHLRTGELALFNPKAWDDRNDSFYIEEYAAPAGHLRAVHGEVSETIGKMLNTNPVVVRRMMSGLRERGYVQLDQSEPKCLVEQAVNAGLEGAMAELRRLLLERFATIRMDPLARNFHRRLKLHPHRAER